MASCLTARITVFFIDLNRLSLVVNIFLITCRQKNDAVA